MTNVHCQKEVIKDHTDVRHLRICEICENGIEKKAILNPNPKKTLLLLKETLKLSKKLSEIFIHSERKNLKGWIPEKCELLQSGQSEITTYKDIE